MRRLVRWARRKPVHALAAFGVLSAISLFAAFILAGPLGIVISLLSSPVYGFYVDAPNVWGLSDLADQQIAGVTMSAEEAIVFFCLCAYYVVRFVREEEARDAFRRPVHVPTSGSP